MQLRDLEWQAHESCDVRFPAAEVDHIEPHSWGGWTVVRNGRVLCDWHNRHRPAGPLRAA